MIVIGPALETFLTVVGAILLVLGGIALLCRPFWKRIVTFFRRWHERDMWLEQQKREDAECRRKAHEEMRAYCHDDILQPAGTQSDAAPIGMEAGKGAKLQTGVSAQTAPPVTEPECNVECGFGTEMQPGAKLELRATQQEDV